MDFLRFDGENPSGSNTSKPKDLEQFILGLNASTVPVVFEDCKDVPQVTKVAFKSLW